MDLSNGGSPDSGQLLVKGEYMRIASPRQGTLPMRIFAKENATSVGYYRETIYF